MLFLSLSTNQSVNKSWAKHIWCVGRGRGDSHGRPRPDAYGNPPYTAGKQGWTDHRSVTVKRHAPCPACLAMPSSTSALCAGALLGAVDGL